MQISLHFELLMRRHTISILDKVGRANYNLNGFKDDIKFSLKVVGFVAKEVPPRRRSHLPL